MYEHIKLYDALRMKRVGNEIHLSLMGALFLYNAPDTSYIL